MMAKPQSPSPFIAAIRKLLPKPVRKVEEADGSTVLIAGDPVEVIIRISDTSVKVFEFSVEWPTPDTPELREVPIASLAWPSLPNTQALDAAAALIKATRESRLAKYQTCKFCKKVNPPEWMDAQDVCQGCGSKEPGHVY
jgi:hypothetical protein